MEVQRCMELLVLIGRGLNQDVFLERMLFGFEGAILSKTDPVAMEKWKHLIHTELRS